MKESVLMLASFEKTTDHLFDAAVHSRQVRCTWLAKQTMLNNAFIVIGCGGGGSCSSCGGSCNGAVSASGSLSGGNYLL